MIKFVSVFIHPTQSITTTHHDKISHRGSNIPINLTLPDRQKRLLPYYNFYLAQDINRPVVLRRYKNPHKYHRITRPLVATQIKPRPGGENLTPFLESNALPGPFIPIQKPQLYSGVDEKVPNYSAIYDKLSQLKLVQRPQQSYQSYVPQYAESDHNSIQPQQQQRQQQQEQQQQEHQQKEPQGKTIIETYTPTEVEITNNSPVQQNVYFSTIKPVLENGIYITTARPEINFEQPKPQPYQLYNLINQDHIQPLTLEELTQYQKDKNQFIDSRKPVIVYQQPEQIQRPVIFFQEPQQSPQKPSLDVILKKLQASNTLPQTLTTDNIDNSIKTLVKILGGLKKEQKFTKPIVVAEESDYVDHTNTDAEQGEGDGAPESVQMYPPDTVEGGTPGRPGVDYPALSTIPQTNFNCKTQRYKGFFGDPDTNCQVRIKIIVYKYRMLANTANKIFLHF